MKMKKLLNPLYRLLTRRVILSSDKEVLERAWKNDYDPYGYKMVKSPHISKSCISGELYKMVVCKTF